VKVQNELKIKPTLINVWKLKYTGYGTGQEEKGDPPGWFTGV
jgi:hypothetical protein